VSLLSNILDVLTDDGQIGGTSGWTGYASVLPDDPDQVVAVFETVGGEPDQDDVSPTYDYPGVQVRVRGQAFGGQAAVKKIEEVVATVEFDTPSRFIYLYGREGGPFFLRFDQNNRPEYVWNLDGMYETAP